MRLVTLFHQWAQLSLQLLWFQPIHICPSDRNLLSFRTSLHPNSSLSNYNQLAGSRQTTNHPPATRWHNQCKWNKVQQIQSAAFNLGEEIHLSCNHAKAHQPEAEHEIAYHGQILIVNTASIRAGCWFVARCVEGGCSHGTWLSSLSHHSTNISSYDPETYPLIQVKTCNTRG